MVTARVMAVVSDPPITIGRATASGPPTAIVTITSSVRTGTASIAGLIGTMSPVARFDPTIGTVNGRPRIVTVQDRNPDRTPDRSSQERPFQDRNGQERPFQDRNGQDRPSRRERFSQDRNGQDRGYDRQDRQQGDRYRESQAGDQPRDSYAGDQPRIDQQPDRQSDVSPQPIMEQPTPSFAPQAEATPQPTMRAEPVSRREPRAEREPRQDRSIAPAASDEAPGLPSFITTPTRIAAVEPVSPTPSPSLTAATAFPGEGAEDAPKFPRRRRRTTRAAGSEAGDSTAEPTDQPIVSDD